MKSARTMYDDDLDGRARSARPASGARVDSALRLPFGVAGVAALCALALGLFGLFMPRAWLETIAFQLYLDRISSAALPPLGTTAQLLAAAVFALGGALFGWLLGRLFGVRPSSLSFHALINRLRGVGDGDEEDAPSLRAADRHPDAPARRPFSAARDIARYEDEWDDEEDALLLDTQFASADDMAPPPPPLGATSGTSFDDHWREAEDMPAPVPPSMPPVAGLIDEDLSATLPAPSLDDWEVDPAPAPSPAPFVERAPLPHVPPHVPPPVPPVMAPRPPLPGADFIAPSAVPPVAPVIRHAGAPEPEPEPYVPPSYRPARSNLPPVEPLDLSAARLDDLLARLESSLGRRQGLAPAAPTAAAIAGLGNPARPAEGGDEAPPSAPPVPAPAASAASPVPAHPEAPVAQQAQDPAYPQDPALAAALRTLRRMNQQATA